MSTLREGVTVIPKNIGRQSILRDRNKNKVATPQPAAAILSDEATVKAVSDQVDNDIAATGPDYQAEREYWKQRILEQMNVQETGWVATPPSCYILEYLGTLYDQEGIESCEDLGPDNAIDADASHIVVKVINEPGEKYINELIFADNGHGFSPAKLLEAMRLAADTGHDENDIGKFGTGMKSAAFNLGNKLVMYTRSEDNPAGLRVEMSIESMLENGGIPGIDWDLMSGADMEFFAKHVPDGSDIGTVISVTGIRNNDRKAKTAEAYRKKLCKRFAVVYRDLLQNPDVRKLTVMGSRQCSAQVITPTPENDPIGWDAYPDGRLCDWTNVKWKATNFQYRAMFVSKTLAVNLEGQPDFNKRGRRATSKQGYSFIRAGRLIAAGEFKDIVGIESNAAYNGLLIEVRFESDLDAEFGVKYTKNGVSLRQGLRDKIESLTKKYRSAAHQSNRQKYIPEDSPSNKEVTEAEFDAYNKQFLPTKERALSLPRPVKSATPSTKSGEKGTTSTKRRGGRRSKFTYDFRPSADVESAELWKAELKTDNTIEARVSTKHPLYDYFHSLDPKDEEHPEYKAMRTTLKHVFFALCSTDLEFEGDDLDFLDRFKSTFARNLRTLMS